MLQVSLWIPVVFLITCLFLVIILCYARPFEVSMGVIITLSGVPAFWLGVVWKNKPLWFRNMLCKYLCCNYYLLTIGFLTSSVVCFQLYFHYCLPGINIRTGGWKEADI